MKTLKYIQITVIILLTLCSCDSCEKEMPTALPPETQTGANTFGCYVNGELFVKNGAAPWGHPALRAVYSVSNNRLGIDVYSSQVNNIGLGLYHPQINVINPISLASFMPRNDSWHSDCSCFVGKETGEIILTKFDTVNNIASGTFSGKIKLDYYDGDLNNRDTIVNITDGRFDIKLDIIDL